MEDSEVVIKVENLHKKFCKSLKRSMAYGTLDLAKSFIGLDLKQGKLRKGEFWSLNDINFELKKGETLGIIGSNGSGKSTLLRLISGIFPPDKGKIAVKGKIGSLIAVGAGFHPHLSGRENVYLNGTILGMTKKEIDSKFEEIVKFADIGDFLDAPLSTYSSGMRVRLGFAIAVFCQPDILLIDEILSVGDLSFRNKSLRKLNEVRQNSKGIIFVSHNLEQVRSLCTRVIILEKGKILYDGETQQGCIMYEEMSREKRVQVLQDEPVTISDSKYLGRQSSDEISFSNIGIFNQNGIEVDEIKLDDKLTIGAEFEINKQIEGMFFSVGILNEEYKPCIWVMSNDIDKKIYEEIKPGKYSLKVEIDEPHLAPGVYIPNIAIRNSLTAETYERILPNKSFRVLSDGKTFERGFIYVREKWNLEKIN